jgi:hypothetical protein
MGRIYTHNGGPNEPHVFMVDVPTGETVGEFNMAPVGDIFDPQAIRLDWTNGDLYLADIGDPTNGRTDIALWKVPEPGPGDHGTLPGIKYPISYPFGPRDAEALAIHPVTGVQYIITKESVGRLVRLPKPLTGNNAGTDMNKSMPAQVTDATFTLDGAWLLIRAEGMKDTIVYNAATFLFDGLISTPQVAEGRSITMEPDGKCFLIGSSGQFSPIFRVCLPAKYLQPPAPPPPPPPPPCNAANTTPDDILPSINARQWKLTLPTPLNCGDDANEISPAQLASGYEISPYFFTICPNAVVFRAPTNGSRTSVNTSFPRSELREMRANGSDEAAWTLGSGQHILDVTQAVTRLPQRSEVCRVVTAQIHDANDDVCVISCDGNSSTQTTGLELWASLNDEHNYRLITNKYVRGRYFRIVMATTGSGVVILYDDFLGGGLRSLFTIPTGQRSGCYFKAGAYTQASTCPRSSGQGGSGFGEVRVRALSIRHQ